MSTFFSEVSLAARLLATLGPLGPQIVLSATLRIVSQGLGIVLLVLGGGAVGMAVSGQGVDVLPFAGLMVALGAVKAVARYGEQVSGHGVAFETLALLRTQAFQALKRQAPATPQGLSSGELVSRLVADIDRIEVFYAHTIGPVCAALVLGTAATFAAGWLGGPPAALAVGLGFVLTAFGIPLVAYRYTREAGAAVRDQKGRLSSLVASALRGSEDLYWAQADHRVADRVTAAGDLVMAQQRSAAGVAGLKDGLTDLVISVTLVSLVLASAVGMPALGALVCLAAGAFGPALAVGRAFDDLPETSASARRLFALLDAPVALVYPPGGADLPPGPLGLAFRSVRLGYDGADVLRGATFAIAPGSRVTVLGPSGGGKTTLARLAVRFLDPSAGTVLLGGRDARDWPEADLRRQVIYLDQDAFVLDGTVGDNLTLFRPGVSPAEWELRLDEVDLWTGAPGRTSRAAGPRGRLLSGGERKRLALARALGGAPGLLVLDEAFSNLDHRTRQSVRQRVLEAAAGLTIVEVTHDPADAEGSDLVLVVDGGQVTVQETLGRAILVP